MVGGEVRKTTEPDGWGFARVGDAKLYYEVEGEGSPLVLIHPQPLDGRVWDEQVPAFSERYRTVRYDRRHWGRTRREAEREGLLAPMPTDEAGLQRWLANKPPALAPHRDLLSLLDFLGIERAHLLGLQDGANVALGFVLERPERTGALVLASPNIAVDFYKPVPWLMEPLESQREWLVPRAVRGVKIWQEASNEAEAKPLLVDWWLEDPAFAASAEATRRELRKILLEDVPPPFALHREHNTARLDPPPGERLHEIAAPTLLLVGEHDLERRRMVEAWLAPDIETSTEATIPGASVMANMDRPEEFNEAVLGFLESVR